VQKVHRASRPTAVTDQTSASAPRQTASRCVFGISQEARRVLEAPRGGCLCKEIRPPRPKMGGGGQGRSAH
jgi:hypothetical protein